MLAQTAMADPPLGAPPPSETPSRARPGEMNGPRKHDTQPGVADVILRWMQAMTQEMERCSHAIMNQG